MAKETTTVQCYPSDSAVNRKIREYEAFGWELINNQRCNEDKGTYGGYRHYSTFNKLTFTREKSAPWYKEVAELEIVHNRLMDSEPYERKPSKILLYASISVLILAFAMLIPISSGFSLMPGLLAIILTVTDIILFVVYGVKKSRYKKEYKTSHSEWERTSMRKALAIREQAGALVNE